MYMQVKNVNAIAWSLVGGRKRVEGILVHRIIMKLGFP
jgi:hypothetical protein